MDVAAELSGMSLDELHGEIRRLRDIVTSAVAEYERQGYKQELFALRDGLSLWKRKAEEAEAKAKESFDRQAIIDGVSDVVSRMAPKCSGTLVQRVEEALGRRPNAALDEDRTRMQTLREVEEALLQMQSSTSSYDAILEIRKMMGSE